MAMAWVTWYDAVLPHLKGLLPGAPADFYIKRAAIEFFDRSCAWRVAQPAFAATATQGVYDLAAPVAATTVVKGLEFRYLGKLIDPYTPAELADKYPNRDWRAITGDPPCGFTCEQPNQVTIIPIPVTTVAAALSGWVAIKPTETATGLPDNLAREYHDPIARLARARAMETKGMPYSDGAKALDLLRELDSEIGFVSFHASGGGGVSARRTRPNWI